MNLKKTDYEIWNVIKNEKKRQQETLILIASENITSGAVLEAQGSVLTNKYAEGYPGKRYYGGCRYVDIAEQLAIDRAKKLFKCEHVNVQPHSGTQSNVAVYVAMLKPGDTIMGMSLSHGGHLSHGHQLNFSGKYFNVVHYGVSKDIGIIDYDEVQSVAEKSMPKLIVAGSSAYSRTIDWKRLRDICDKIGAYLMADIAHYAGLIAAGAYPSPVDYADFVTTTTHKTLRGPRGGIIMCKEKYAAAIDKAVFPGIQGGPLMHIIAAKAVALKEALSPGFKKYQFRVLKNARALASALAKKGYKIVSGGTDCHLFLVDLTSKKLTGLEIEKTLDKAGITLNKNTIPYDTQKPFVASGIRIGTPSVTTRGMEEKEMRVIADFIDEAIHCGINNEKCLLNIKAKVKMLCRRFPL